MHWTEFFKKGESYATFSDRNRVKTPTLPLSALFAGKMHAALYREWGRRVKGRDWYDVLWYLKKKIPLDFNCMKLYMQHLGTWNPSQVFGQEDFLQAVLAKIEQVDWTKAVQDVRAFTDESQLFEPWSKAFFSNVIKEITFC